MTLGMPTWPIAGPPLAMLAAIGAWWRFLALRSISGALTDSRPRLWQWLAAAGGVAGLAQGGLACLRGVGLEVPALDWLLPAWGVATIFEVLAAMTWVLVGSWERGSRWMAVPIGLAGTLMLAAVGAQALAVSTEGMPRFVSVLLFAMMAVGGVAGPLLLGDAASRLAASLCSESLDEETERAASRGGRLPGD